MKSYTEHLHEALLSDLADLDNQYNPQNLVDRRLGIIAAAIDQVKEKLKPYVFDSSDEEVSYFKWVLPPLLSLYIYYRDKIEWDRISRLGSTENQYRFTDRIYSQAETFRKDNPGFCEYYRDGKTDLDHLYFRRESPANREKTYPVRCIVDPSSPPLHAELLATLMAYTRLEQEMKSGISEIKPEMNSIKMDKSRFRWTGKQIDFIELIYSLSETGSINHGKTSLNDLFLFFAQAFEFDPGNTTRLFQDILRRKAGYTVFLDQLKQKLCERIDRIEAGNLNRSR